MSKELFMVEYDGMVGERIGSYVTREGKRGVVLQQVGTKIVHVYGENRVVPAIRLTTQEDL